MSKEAGIGSGSASRLAAAPVRSLDRVLLELSMSDAVTSGNLDEALHEICTTASRAFDLRSTNVWLFDPTHATLTQAVTFARDQRWPFASLPTAPRTPDPPLSGSTRPA
jgi:hypothetical protein